MNAVARIEAATPADQAPLETLLRGNDLPLAGFGEHLASTLVARGSGGPVGCAALELYGEDALLRSVVTADAVRGTGLGQALVREVLALAGRSGASRVWLLTTTAAEFFRRFGFRRSAREDVPAAMLQSAELRGACPSTAVLMRLDLTPATAG